MAEGKLKVATCQFAVSSSIRRNSRAVCDFIKRAADRGAELVHFSECAISGYAGTDFESFKGYDWQLLHDETRKVMELAGRLKVWVVLGSVHRLTEPNMPHNSLYLINSQGQIQDRYDKRFCTAWDLLRHTPGNRFVIFEVNNIKCSLLICFDVRFPELYRELYRQGVECVFQSFYNARQKGPSVHTDIMRQSMQCMAATNHFWSSMSNCSAYYSPYPSCFIAPDGRIERQLAFNRAGMMINKVDKGRQFYDPMKEFRKLVIEGKLTNAGRKLDDPRSKDTTSL